MRFFTNENKDETDPKDVDVKERGGSHNDATESADTVALPQQRGNSPWSSTPDGTPEHDAGPDATTAPDASGSHRWDADDEPLIEDPTPPDHAVADTAPDARADSDPDTVAEPTTDSAEKGWAGPTAAGDRADDDETSDDKGATLRDGGDFDDPKVADADETTDGKGATLRDGGDFDDPKVVSHEVTTTDTAVVVAEPEPVPAATTAAVPGAPVAPDAPGTDTAAKPGEVDAPAVTTIFDAGDAKAFQDRWRDVQLRFVDSPKEATAEAATLVDDAVEQLTASLRSQKEQFGGESTEDTEKLRVELRGYREIFNRIIGL
ncbi:hypothetical protein [Actinoplanes sp. NPDC089786]|uniref:hypothetical protein n=1 Tax=Actinoplanes sp. NPDC089786 TaxID=3155185 RepID=UPI00342EE07C